MNETRLLSPLFISEPAPPPAKASMLNVRPCPTQTARPLIAEWHSRLPTTQRGPWSLAYVAEYGETAFAVALWHNPSARTLPQDWLELRRLAVAPDAPHCTASMMLGRMRKHIRAHRPDIVHLISYQDEDVHTGTIYRAAGWTAEHRTERRQRDRTTTRPSGRMYRTSINGTEPDAAAKIRWGINP